MNRYKHQQVKRGSDGRRKLSTIQYPKIVSKNSDIIYRTKESDTYSGLAYRFYKDQSLWWVIARANKDYKGNIRPKLGIKLIIPRDISDIITKLNRDNTTGN
jgi:nucleoid-associated protein YgaU|tara:strand:+ start:479 stop:784 length:306 start_codon:yes stop_codon:yes gene_type:complete